jgi:hypothetical protein
MKPQRRSRGSFSSIVFCNHGAGWGWVVRATPRLLYTRKRDPVPNVQEAGSVPWPIWTSAKISPMSYIKRTWMEQVNSVLTHPCHILGVSNSNPDCINSIYLLVSLSKQILWWHFKCATTTSNQLQTPCSFSSSLNNGSTCYGVVIDPIERSPPWDSHGSLAGQWVPRILCHPNVHYHIHNSPPLSISRAGWIYFMASHLVSLRLVLVLSSS